MAWTTIDVYCMNTSSFVFSHIHICNDIVKTLSMTEHKIMYIKSKILKIMYSFVSHLAKMVYEALRWVQRAPELSSVHPGQPVEQHHIEMFERSHQSLAEDSTVALLHKQQHSTGSAPRQVCQQFSYRITLLQICLKKQKNVRCYMRVTYLSRNL